MKIKKMHKEIFIDPNPNIKEKYLARVGYFSGTFDPFHEDHSRVARLASNYLDEIWIQPHNFNLKKVPIEITHRINMINLAIAALPNCYLLNYPQDLSSNKYKLMRDLEDGLIGLIISDVIGMDHLQKTIKFGIERDTYCVVRENFQEQAHERVFLIKSNDMKDTSSSKIRELIKNKNYRNLPLNVAVLEYIIRNQLYQ